MAYYHRPRGIKEAIFDSFVVLTFLLTDCHPVEMDDAFKNNTNSKLRADLDEAIRHGYMETWRGWGHGDKN